MRCLQHPVSDSGLGSPSPWFTVIDRKDWMGQTPFPSPLFPSLFCLTSLSPSDPFFSSCLPLPPTAPCFYPPWFPYSCFAKRIFHDSGLVSFCLLASVFSTKIPAHLRPLLCPHLKQQPCPLSLLTSLSLYHTLLPALFWFALKIQLCLHLNFKLHEDSAIAF